MPVELRGRPLSIHAVGIGGSGMSGLARILAGLGHRVTGSDALQGGHDAGNLPADAALVVASAAVPPSNPELVEARRRGVPVLKYAEAAGLLMLGKRGVAVAGTHGKTTTTSAVAFVLRAAGRDPGFLIGGSVPQLGGSSGCGRGEAFVVEACEYDRSFLSFRPEIAVVTNIDADHLDYYRDLDEIEQAFRDFAAGAGRVISCGDDPRARGLGGETYGFSEGCTWRMDALRTGEEGCRYRLEGMDLSTPLAGVHNALNTAAAAAACLRLGIPPEDVRKGIAGFRGAGRRLERVGEARGIEVFDDYGHHPREIACTLEALRQRRPGRPFRILFQPHQAHRTRVFLKEFAAVLASGSEEVLVPNIFGARESGVQEVGPADLVRAITEAGGKASEADGLEDAARRLAASAKRGDVLLTLGAGDVGTLAPRLLAFLG